jgi:hypothetical protein
MGGKKNLCGSSALSVALRLSSPYIYLNLYDICIYCFM